MSTSALLTLSEDDLDERAAQLEAQIVTSGAAILDVVVKDLDKFIPRETKRRFLDHVEFASAMDEATLRALKADLRTLTGTLTGTLRAELTANDIWLAAELPEDRKSMRGNPPVWMSLQKIACQLAGVFVKYGFPPDAPGQTPEYNLEYDTPRYFIEHLYCPGLIEAYWKQNEELAMVRATAASRARALSQEDLEARWNAID